MNVKTGIAVASLAVVAIAMIWATGNGPMKEQTTAPGSDPGIGNADVPDTVLGSEGPAEAGIDTEDREEPARWSVPSGVLVSEYPGRFEDVPPVTDEWIEANFVLPYVQESDYSGCKRLELPGGKVICWEQYAFHPYLQYGIDSLTAIAETDAEAAAALSVMLVNVDNEASFKYAFHASELSGKMGPLRNFITQVEYDETSVDALLDLYAVARYVEFRGWDRPLAYNYEHFLVLEGLTKDDIVAAANDRSIDKLGFLAPAGGGQ